MLFLINQVVPEQKLTANIQVIYWAPFITSKKEHTTMESDKKSEQVQILTTGREKIVNKKRPPIADEVIAYAQALDIEPEEAVKKLRSTFGTDDPKIIKGKVIRFLAIIGIILGSLIGYISANFFGLVVGAICGGAGLPIAILFLGKILKRV